MGLATRLPRITVGHCAILDSTLSCELVVHINIKVPLDLGKFVGWSENKCLPKSHISIDKVVLSLRSPHLSVFLRIILPLKR